MRLLLHQIVKDLRLLRWHVAAWLLLVGAANVLALVAASRWSPNRTTLTDLPFIVSILDVIASAVMVVVAAMVVQADAPTSSTAFWPTRPASRAVVAGSKIIFGLVFLALVPVAWNAIDLAVFGVSPAWVPLLTLALVAVWTVVPMAAAGVTPNLSQFLLITLFQIVIFLAVVGIGDAFGLRPGVGNVAVLGLFGIAAVTCAAIMVVAYLTRRQRLSAALVGLGPVVVFGLAVAIWPYDMNAAWRLYDGPGPSVPVGVEVDAPAITLTPRQGIYRLSVPLRLDGVPGGTRVSVLPTTGRSWMDVPGKRVTLSPAESFLQSRVVNENPTGDWNFLRSTLGARFTLLNPTTASPPAEVTCRLRLFSGDYARYADANVTLHVAATIRFSEWRAASTMGLRQGERCSAEGSAMEIGTAWVEGRKVVARVREVHAFPQNGPPATFSYFLRNRVTGEAIAARYGRGDVRRLAMSSFRVPLAPVFPVTQDLWVDWLDLVFDVDLSPTVVATGAPAWLASSELLVATRRDVGNKEVRFDLRDVRLGALPEAEVAPGTHLPREETRK